MFAQDWPYVGRHAGGTRHSSLAQITRANVAKLEIAWTFDTEDWSDGKDMPSRSSFEATPLVIDGILYVPSPMSRLFALDAETGKRIWVFDAAINKTIPRNLFVNRGVSFWTDGKKRLIYLGDIQGGLWAVDAWTGELNRGFGESGKVDLRAGMATVMLAARGKGWGEYHGFEE
jgi:quinoprotein glucose dehydrogenase